MSDNETLNRDKLLLKLMIHAYDEDLARNELVDTKKQSNDCSNGCDVNITIYIIYGFAG